MVPINITGRSDKVTSRQKDHARDKISKLERYFNGITKIDVILDQEADRSKAEVVISVKKGSAIVCHHDDDDLYKAIDLLLDKAEIQLTRHKERVQKKRSGQKPDFAALQEMQSEPDDSDDDGDDLDDLD